jgi:hypothetical protein
MGKTSHAAACLFSHQPIHSTTTLENAVLGPIALKKYNWAVGNSY